MKFTLPELSERTGIDARTIRYYIERGLALPAKGTTRAAYYTDRHLRQLRDIQRLRLEGRSLREIKRVLRGGPSQALVESARHRGHTVQLFVDLGHGMRLSYEPTGPWRLEANVEKVVDAASSVVEEIADSAAPRESGKEF